MGQLLFLSFSPALQHGGESAVPDLFRTHFHLASMSENITWDKAWSTGSIDSGKEGGGEEKCLVERQLDQKVHSWSHHDSKDLYSMHLKGNCGQNGFALRFWLLRTRAGKNLLEGSQHLSTPYLFVFVLS